MSPAAGHEGVEERRPVRGWARRTLYGGGGPAGAAWRGATAPLARVWREAARLRLEGRVGARAVRLPAPTVSVGNVTVGGGGKTSLVRWLLAEGLPEGTDAAVLTRGYGRAGTGTRVVEPGSRPDPAAVGDEPALLAREGVWVGVGEDRVRAARAVARRALVDAFVLDDGLQHRRVARALDVVSFTAEDLAAPARCLPAGPLRQGPGWVPALGAWVVVGVDPREASWPAGSVGAAFERWWRTLPGTAASWVDAGTVELAAWVEGTDEPLVAGGPAVAVAGVARPETVRDFAAAAGWRVERVAAFPDHHAYVSGDLARVLADHPEATLLVTEKDAIKIDPAWLGGRRAGVLRRRLAPRDAELLRGLVREALARVS